MKTVFDFICSTNIFCFNSLSSDLGFTYVFKHKISFYRLPFGYGASLYGSLGLPGPPMDPPPPGPPLTCIEFLRCNIASCGDIGGNGTPRFGGLPGLEL